MNSNHSNKKFKRYNVTQNTINKTKRNRLARKQSSQADAGEGMSTLFITLIALPIVMLIIGIILSL